MNLDNIQLQVPMCAIFRRHLKAQGLKFTTERALILDAVLEHEGVFEAEALLDALKTGGRRASKATVYRTLKHMLDAGILRQVLIDPSRAHYRVCYGQPPMGQMVCVETHQVIEFPLDVFRKQIEAMCDAHGFKPHATQLVIHGLSHVAQENADKD